MAIGSQPTVAQLNAQLASVATGLRTTAQQILSLWSYANGLGQAGLVTLGFAAADATAFITAVDNLATVAQVYQGTVQQGGTGGTGASLFNFQTALATVTGPY
jgi:hypothetical protein